MGLFRVTEMHDGAAASPTVIQGRRLALVLLGVVPLVLAACGGSSASGSGTSTTKPTGTASEAAYTACLKEHGVTLPNFSPGTGRAPTGGETPPSFTPGSGSFPAGGAGGFRNNPQFAKAAAACKSLRPAGGTGGFGPGGGTGGFNSTAFAAYRNCLSLHGVTLPTGGARPGTTGSTPPTTTAQSNATMQAAEAACAALRPTASSTTTTAG